MPPRRRPRSIAAIVAAAAGLATLAVAAPALGQVDPGVPTTTVVGPDPTTTVTESSTTTIDPTSTTDTTVETTETTEPIPVAVAVDTPFPVALVAPVPPVEGNPDTAITDLYVTDGASPDEPDVVVQFREPFEFAGTPYRVGVVIGDPTGTRLRTWLISNGPGNLPFGRVERFEAGTWTELGATPVRFENGLMVITVPIAEATATGGAIWAEIVENDAETPSHTTPYFSRDALFGTADAGTVPSAIFGRVFGLDGVAVEPIELPVGGTLVSIEDQIAVTYPDAPPTEVAGQPVTSAVDIIRIAPDYDDGAVLANFVRFDRTTGEVGLYDGFAPTPIDKSGDRSWLISSPPPREAGVLVLDRSAIVAALGLPAEGANIALGVSREVVLEDGRFVAADGVLATDAWLDLAPLSALPEVTTTTAAAPAATPQVDDARQDRLPLLIGAGVGLVVLLLLVVGVRRRSGRRAAEIAAFDAAALRSKSDRMPWGSSDGDLIITTTHEFDALIPADATPLPTPSPVAPSVVLSAPAGSGVRILGESVAAPEPEPVAPVVEPVVETVVEVVVPPVGPPEASSPSGEPPAAVAEPATPLAEAAIPVSEPAAADPAPASGAARSPLDAEPAWASTASSPPSPSPSPSPEPELVAEVAAAAVPVGTAPEPAAPSMADEVGPEDATPLDPGRVDPMAALSALDQDMDELRRRVASLGDG